MLAPGNARPASGSMAARADQVADKAAFDHLTMGPDRGVIDSLCCVEWFGATEGAWTSRDASSDPLDDRLLDIDGQEPVKGWHMSTTTQLPRRTPR